MADKRILEGKAVAVLILLIALFMVLYLLFIPPAEREALLGNGDSSSTSISPSSSITELLAKSPGLIEPKSKAPSSHEMPNINLYVRTEPETTSLTNSLFITKSWFSTTSPKLSFTLKNLENLKKANLFFNVAETEGTFKIYLNENPIYENEIPKGFQIIPVPTAYLKESNTLEFRATTPFGFWDKNKIQLTDLGIKKEFELINAKEEKTFALSTAEYKDLESATFSYYQVCNHAPHTQTTPLTIYINNKKLDESELRCVNMKKSIDVPLAYLKEGTNTMLFMLEQGDFSLNDVSINTIRKSESAPSFYFSITSSQIDSIRNDKKDAILKIASPDSKNKVAHIFINNEEIVLNTQDLEFTTEISDMLVQGSNYIRVVPSNSFRINTLRVNLE